MSLNWKIIKKEDNAKDSSALKEELENAKYEMKKLVDERIDEAIYSKIIEIKRTFEKEKKKFNTEVEKILKKNEKEITELRESFVEEINPLIKNLELIETNEKKIKEIGKLKRELDKAEEKIQVLENDVTEIRRFIGNEIKSLNYALRESIESYIEQMINDLKDAFESRFNSLLKRIKKIESYKKKLKHIDTIYEKFNDSEKKLEELKPEISRIKRNFDEKIRKVNENVSENTEIITNVIISDLENLKEKIKSIDFLSNRIEDLEMEKTRMGLLNNKINKNKKNLNGLIEEVYKLKQNFESKIDSLSKKIRKVKIDEEKVKNIDEIEKKTEGNRGKVEELTRVVNQVLDTLNNTPSQKTFHDSFSKLNQQIFTLGEKVKDIEEKIKQTQRDTKTDYLRLEAAIKNAETNANKLQKRIDLILKKVNEIRTSPVKGLIKKQREMETKISKLEEKLKKKTKESKVKSKIRPRTREKKVRKKKTEKEMRSTVEEIKNKIVEKTKDIISQPADKLKENLEVDVDISEKGKHKEKEKSKEKQKEGKEFMCRYCHRSFNNQRLLEIHEMVCEKRH